MAFDFVYIQEQTKSSNSKLANSETDSTSMHSQIPAKPAWRLSNLYVGGNLMSASRIPWKTFPAFISALS